MSIHDVAELLHEINLMEKKRKPQAAAAKRAELSKVLRKEQLDLIWNNEEGLWGIYDTLFE